MKIRNFKKDKSFSDQFIPQVKKILGEYLITEATFSLDANEATDLLIMQAKDLRIACRIRRYGYYHKFPNEFTIRSIRDSGAKTEMEKITNGFSDYYLYGHASKCQTKVEHYFVLDMRRFRSSLIRANDELKNKMYTKQKNTNENSFLCFDIRKFEPEMLIASA